MYLLRIAALWILPSALFAADPVLGTWTLNLNKSSYVPGPAPKSQIRIYAAHAEGIKVTIRTVGTDGKPATVEHPVNYDGKAHALTGESQADAIRLEKIDENTSESVLMHAGKVIGRNRRVVSEDGKTMTITFEGTDNLGRMVRNRAVYDRAIRK